MEYQARTRRRGIFSLSFKRFGHLKLLLEMDEKPCVDFGHDDDPLGGVRQELRRLVPHRCLRAVPRITAVSVSFFDPGN